MFDSFLGPYGVIASAPRMVAQQTYAIVEPLLEPELMKWLYQGGGADLKHAKLFAESDYSAQADKGPVLVQLPADNNAFATLMKAFEATPSGCFIHSAAGFERLLVWARLRLAAQTNNAKALLRFYEPRMLLPLLGSLKDHDKARFLAGIDAIYWFHHQWLSSSNDVSGSASQQDLAKLEYTTLVMDASQFNNLENLRQQWTEQQGQVSHAK